MVVNADALQALRDRLDLRRHPAERAAVDGDEEVEIDEAEFEKFIGTEAGEKPTPEELERIAEGMASLRNGQAAENAYEASKYGE